ncbi:MAG: PsiF family protein [Burkholderiales bacterium]|nr:PsiF family protein [Burkholderiales bacterium]
MKRLLSIAAALTLACSTSAFANAHKEAPNMKAASGAAPSASMTAQQSKMGDCNKKATGKTGDDRKAFMKTCLSADAPMSQQDKMKKCNVDATGKTGDDRKAFMKTCLSS